MTEPYPLMSCQIPRAGRWPGDLWVAALILITLAGFGLRSSGIETHSFWYDEAVTAELSQAPVLDLLQGKAKDNGNPPFYWVAAGYASHLCGSSDAALRSLSVLAGTLSIPLLALIGLRLFGPATGLIAAGLLAVSPFALELSTEARAYALLQFLTLANLVLFIRWADNRSRICLALYGLTLALCCLTHYYALAIPVAEGAALLVARRERRFLVPWTMVVLTAGLVCCAWLPAFLQQVSTSGNLSRGGDAWHFQFLATPLVFALGRTYAWRSDSLSTLALATVVSVTLFWLLAAWGFWKHRRDSFSSVLVGTWLLLPILGPLLVAVTLSPVYAVRYASLSQPALLLLLAYGLRHLTRQRRVLVAGGIAMLTAISIQGFFLQPLKDDWRSAALEIFNRADASEPIVFDTDSEVVSFRHYAARYGKLQRQMWGLTGGLSSGTLDGVGFKYGQRQDDVSRDCTTEIVAAPSFWLATCVPQATPEDYAAYFARHGYRMVGSLHFHRIDVLHFTKITPPSTELALTSSHIP